MLCCILAGVIEVALTSAPVCFAALLSPLLPNSVVQGVPVWQQLAQLCERSPQLTRTTQQQQQDQQQQGQEEQQQQQ